VYFRVLGPVEIWDEDRCIPVGTSKTQHVLAILLLASGLSVSARSLADRLWDGDPPAKERETIQSYISRIRRRLRDAGDSVGLIRASSSDGYLLDVPAESVDARRFDQAVTRAHAAVSDPAAAVALFRQAEALWGGEPLAGIKGQWADGTRRALWERRRSAVLTRIDLELLLGNNPDDLVSELAVLTAIGGVDQIAVGLLMRALARAGRLADALSTFRTARTRLREELGADPSSELRSIHHRILKGESDPPTPRRSGVKARTGPSPAANMATDQTAIPAPNTLDRDPRHLVGRDTELEDLLATVRKDLRAEAGGVAICALDGMPGIGKTSLAVRAAHLLRADCPEGQIQLNFRSHHPHQSPISPLEALHRLLDEIGTPVQDIGRAESIDALAALWRRRINGKRLLLLFDDVQDTAQVEFLLPTSPGAAVLLTSRRRLSGISGLRQRSLSTLPDDAAHALLLDITERSFAVGADAEAEAEAVERFVVRCGGVPLAITVSAAHLRKRPNWTLGDLVERLNHPGPRSADDQITGPVDTAIALSYYSLPVNLRTLLRHLAGHPGPDIGLAAAAALAQADTASTDLDLDTLVEHHLVEETTRHRYRLHDLIREFALDRGWHEQTLDDVEEAVHRAFRFYLRTAEHANQLLHPYYPAGGRDPRAHAAEPGEAAVNLDSRKSVRSWLDSEAANLTAILGFAAAHDWRDEATSLLHVLAGHLDRRGHWREAIGLLREAAGGDTDHSLAATSGTDDFATKALIHTDLAGLHARTGELDKALAHATKALTIWTVNGHRYGQAEATLQTGRLHWLAGRRSEAVEILQAAAEMFGSVDAPDRRATAEYHLGIGLFELGRLRAAFDTVQRVLGAATALGDAELRCDVLINLGKMHLITDDCDAAMAYFHQAEPLATEFGDPQCLAVLATNIGAVHRRRGQADLALASFREALAWSRSGADARNEAETLIEAAAAHTDLGNHRIASRHLNRALHLAEEGEDPLQIAHVNLATGTLRLREGDRAAALRCYTTALAEAESAQAPLDQAHALRAIGELLAPDEPAAGWRYLARAKGLYQRLGLNQAASAIARAPRPPGL
jgi:DNA-binding SARP family transcriptional activator/tetratricopeptide (TPR) repeat protein